MAIPMLGKTIYKSGFFDDPASYIRLLEGTSGAASGAAEPELLKFVNRGIVKIWMLDHYYPILPRPPVDHY